MLLNQSSLSVILSRKLENKNEILLKRIISAFNCERERNFGFWLYDHSDCERRFLDISISYFFFFNFFPSSFYHVFFCFVVVCLFVLFSLVLFRHCPNMTYIYIYIFFNSYFSHTQIIATIFTAHYPLLLIIAYQELLLLFLLSSR